ncbi:hypothetical protein ACHAXT_007173 [Thalassiosira profunda]
MPVAGRSKRGGTTSTQRDEEIDAWWQIDSLKSIDSTENALLTGASRVVKAFLEDDYIAWFCKADGKTPDELFQTAAVVKAYRQFIDVKNQRNDWDANKLSPCILVEIMWKAHSQLPAYASDMKLLCGRAVQFVDDEDIDDDEAGEEAARVQATVDAIQARCGSVDERVWNACSVSMDRLDICNGEVYCYLRDKTTPFATILEQWAKVDGVNVDDYKYFYGERELKESDTIGSLGSTDIDIDGIPKAQNTPTYVRLVVGDSDCNCSVLKTTPLAGPMKEYANDCGVDRASLVFLWNEQKLYGFETAVQLGMGRFAIIKVLQADSAKNPRCICCNPSTELFKVG